jgi:hypothetical protein
MGLGVSGIPRIGAHYCRIDRGREGSTSSHAYARGKALRLCRSCPALCPRAADIDRVWPTLDITQHRPTTILLTLVDMRKVEAVEMPRGLAEANAPVLRSIVRNLSAIERAFGRGIPRYLGDYADVYDELMAAASARVPGSPRPPIWSI